jgi:signal transduction histidine kinase
MLQGREDTMQALAEHATLLERDREARVRDARREERGLIARELHDVVAHNVSVVIVQAQAASALLEHQPADARRPLERIESTAREAMAEMRRLVGILDTNDDQEERERPQPGMLQLPELIARVGEAGLHVDADLDPELEGLPAGLSLAAYRVVQEALTNVLKHANASRVRVRVRHSKTELSIAIIDNGHGLPVSGSGGRGLVGMQQRVALYGGTVDAGPRVDGGFAVNAVFPIQAEPA